MLVCLAAVIRPASAQVTGDLSIGVGGSPNPVAVNANVSYTIAVAVPAGGATGVTITDILPVGVTFVSGTPNCANNQGTVTCALGTLGAGTATATIVVTPTAQGTLKNVVGVIANEYDPNMSNNSAIVTTTAGGCGITSITPSVGPIVGGQTVVIRGSCFTGATNVQFQFAFATPSWRVDSDTQITATTPGLPIGYGPVNVTVVTPTASYVLPNGYTYTTGSSWTFTDDPLIANQTIIRAVHITELRQDIDILRTRVGLGGAPWHDSPLQPRITVVRAIHIQELRTYLDDALARLGYATSPYTDPGLTPGYLIRKLHIDELRQRIKNVP